MGIDIRYYTVYGIKHPYISELSEEHEDCYDEVNIIFDGMGGTYTIIGKPLFVSDNLRWNDGDGDYFKEIDISKLPNIKEEYIKNFEKYLPQWKHLLDGEWKLMTFAHYS